MLRQLTKAGPARDKRLEARIQNMLWQHRVPGCNTLEVEAIDGVVTIRGRVNCFYHRQLCIHCCQRVAGVYRLVDEVEVEDVA